MKRKHKYLGLKRTLQVLLLIPLTNLASCGISGVVQDLYLGVSFGKYGFSPYFIEEGIKHSNCTPQEKEDYRKGIFKEGHYTTDSAGSQIRQRYEQKDLQRSL